MDVKHLLLVCCDKSGGGGWHKLGVKDCWFYEHVIVFLCECCTVVSVCGDIVILMPLDCYLC